MCTILASVSRGPVQVAAAASGVLAASALVLALVFTLKVYQHIKMRRAQIVPGGIPTSVNDAVQIVMGVLIQVTYVHTDVIQNLPVVAIVIHTTYSSFHCCHRRRRRRHRHCQFSS